MVILTFFLIFTAVFSKTRVVEVNLPGPEVQAPPTVPTLELEVILRRNGIEVADRNVGVLRTIPLTATGYQDALRLSEHLVDIKSRFPDKANATLLVAEDVDYDTIVQVMDAMRVQVKVEGTKVSSTTLFPQSPWETHRKRTHRQEMHRHRQEMHRNDRQGTAAQHAPWQERPGARAARADTDDRHDDDPRGVPAGAHRGHGDPAEFKKHHDPQSNSDRSRAKPPS